MGLCHRSVAGWVSVLLRTFHLPSLNRRPWRSISKRLFNKVTFALQRTLLLQALSSWPRTTEACALVSITGHSTKSQSSSVILFLSSQRHSNITKEINQLQQWRRSVWRTPLLISEKDTGRKRFIEPHPWATTNSKISCTLMHNSMMLSTRKNRFTMGLRAEEITRPPQEITSWPLESPFSSGML